MKYQCARRERDRERERERGGEIEGGEGEERRKGANVYLQNHYKCHTFFPLICTVFSISWAVYLWSTFLHITTRTHAQAHIQLVYAIYICLCLRVCVHLDGDSINENKAHTYRLTTLWISLLLLSLWIRFRFYWILCVMEYQICIKISIVLLSFFRCRCFPLLLFCAGNCFPCHWNENRTVRCFIVICLCAFEILWLILLLSIVNLCEVVCQYTVNIYFIRQQHIVK